MRSRFCPDADCQPIWSDFTEEDFKKGASHICVGILQRPHIFLERKTKHVNDCSFCIYTPLKGFIRFFINADDAWTDIVALSKLLEIKMPLRCSICGETSRLGVTYYVKDKKRYCNFCYLRLGFIQWHEDEKKYY